MLSPEKLFCSCMCARAHTTVFQIFPALNFFRAINSHVSCIFCAIQISKHDIGNFAFQVRF